MAGRLENKVVLISGTAQGLGRAGAVRFAEEGARVVGCDLDATRNRETVELVRSSGYEMMEMSPVDPSDPDDAQRWIDAAVETYGRIDVLYNNAASVRHGRVDGFPTEDWHFSMRNVVDIVFFPTRAAWPHLELSSGVIISTASVAAHVAITGQVAYAAGKGAVIAMTRVFAGEGGPHGIRAYSISPGRMMTEKVAEFTTDPAVREAAQANTILNRLGAPEDVANLACFLASDEASHMTAVDIPVDGGTIFKYRSPGGS